MSPALRFSARLLLVVTLTAIVAACGARSAEPGAVSARRDPNVLDTNDLRGKGFPTVYDALTRLKPDWLLARGGRANNMDPVLGVFIGTSTTSVGVNYLRALRPEDIRSVTRLGLTEALHTYSWPWGGLVLRLR